MSVAIDGVRRQRPVAEGLFAESEVPGELPELFGSCCRICGEVVFPRMRDCPLCTSFDSMAERRLRGRGVVHDFVVARRGPSGFTVPYIQAYIELDDGPLVYTMIDGCSVDDDALAVGQPVEMSLGTVRTEDGVDIMGWIFHPVERRDLEQRHG